MSKSNVTANDIRKIGHPLFTPYIKWLGNRQDTKRQARKFLQKYPQYRVMVAAGETC